MCVETLKCVCGGDTKYYHGALGYESMLCQRCGFHWDTKTEADHIAQETKYKADRGIDAPVVRVPRKYGNKYFDMMEAPLECWPAITQVQVRLPETCRESVLIVEIPTAEVWTKGDFVARRYAATTFTSIERWLKKNRPELRYRGFGVLNLPEILPDESYAT